MAITYTSDSLFLVPLTTVLKIAISIIIGMISCLKLPNILLSIYGFIYITFKVFLPSFTVTELAFFLTTDLLIHEKKFIWVFFFPFLHILVSVFVSTVITLFSLLTNVNGNNNLLIRDLYCNDRNNIANSNSSSSSGNKNVENTINGASIEVVTDGDVNINATEPIKELNFDENRGSDKVNSNFSRFHKVLLPSYLLLYPSTLSFGFATFYLLDGINWIQDDFYKVKANITNGSTTESPSNSTNSIKPRDECYIIVILYSFVTNIFFYLGLEVWLKKKASVVISFYINKNKNKNNNNSKKCGGNNNLPIVFSSNSRMDVNSNGEISGDAIRGKTNDNKNEKKSKFILSLKKRYRNFMSFDYNIFLICVVVGVLLSLLPYFQDRVIKDNPASDIIMGSIKLYSGGAMSLMLLLIGINIVEISSQVANSINKANYYDDINAEKENGEKESRVVGKGASSRKCYLCTCIAAKFISLRVWVKSFFSLIFTVYHPVYVFLIVISRLIIIPLISFLFFILMDKSLSSSIFPDSKKYKTFSLPILMLCCFPSRIRPHFIEEKEISSESGSINKYSNINGSPDNVSKNELGEKNDKKEENEKEFINGEIKVSKSAVLDFELEMEEKKGEGNKNGTVEFPNQKTSSSFSSLTHQATNENPLINTPSTFSPALKKKVTIALDASPTIMKRIEAFPSPSSSVSFTASPSFYFFLLYTVYRRLVYLIDIVSFFTMIAWLAVFLWYIDGVN